MGSAFLLNKILKLLEEFSNAPLFPEGMLVVSPEFGKCDIPSDLLKNALIQLSSDIKAIVEEQNSQTPSNSVQITASKSQLDQRISAFQHHAQNAVDQQNIHEFFPNKSDSIRHDGCARTHAVYQRRPARRTHVQVSRVKNVEGPQTQIDSQGSWRAVKREISRPINCPEGVEERLKNLERHTGLNKDTAPRDVYARLKTLEDRVLQLEAISPEYFNDVKGQKSEQTSFLSNDTNQLSLDQIDDRIRFLKKKLLSKRVKLG